MATTTQHPLPRIAAGLLITLSLGLANAAHAADSWMNITSPPGPLVSGSVGLAPITLASSYPSGSPATGYTLSAINSGPSGAWDNAAAPNSAGIYPASAAGTAQDIVLSIPAAATPANPARVTISFAKDVLNPTVLIYSIDNSALDFTPAVNSQGEPAQLSMLTNSSGAVTGKHVTTNSTGPGAPEGCAANSRRTCAVVSFTGIYQQIAFDSYLTSGGGDGVGIQVGIAGLAPAIPVPTQSTGAWLLGLALALGLGLTSLKRKSLRSSRSYS